MEKIININIGGRVIAIEDAAYTMLKAYIESLRGYFAGEEGGDEIMADIESRIAELMWEKLQQGATSINAAHIAEIEAGMGTTQDFSTEEAPTGGASYAPPVNPALKKRFVRDLNDKMLGGVCSGMAAWLNIDPALVRIVFAVLTLGGFGTGILLYIALWIFVPAAALAPYSGKRLFRNPDEKVLGGVAGGLAAYFDKETWIFRLIFGLPILLSVFSGFSHVFIGPSIVFGSFTGTFIIIYIILWIVLPMATTDFQKMEMRGQKVDLSSIRQNVYAGMGDVRARAKEWSAEARESATQFMNTRGRQFAQEAAAAARPVAGRGLHIIGLLLKIFLLCIVGSIAFALFATMVTYSFSGAATFVNRFILGSPGQVALGWASIILLLGVPLVGLITWLIRRIMKVRSSSRYMGWTFGGLWVIGFICAAVFVASLTQEFRTYQSVTTEVATLRPVGKRLTLDVPGEGIYYRNTLPWLHGPIMGWDINGDSIHSANVNLHTALSPDSQYHIRLIRYAAGSSSPEANNRAGSLSYALSAPSDSLLVLGNGYAISAGQKYRGQRVVVEVQVPKGAALRLSNNVIDKLRPGVFVIVQDGRRNYFEHSRAHFLMDADVDYVMGSDGALSDPLHPERRLDDASTEARDDYQWSDRRSHRGYRREASRIADSTERAIEMKTDSLDRAMERLQQAKDALNNRDGDNDE